jgi:hypothetical protein
MFRRDPGPCPVCGAAHTTCTAATGPVMVVQLPARDGARTPVLREATPVPVLSSTPVNDAIQAALPAGQMTTAHYRGEKGRRR